MPDFANHVIVAGLIVSAIGLWLAMPQRKAWLANVAGFASAVGLLAIVRASGAPAGDISDRVLFRGIDAGAIDGVANGSAALVRGLAARGLKYAQTGLAQSYLFFMLAGTLAILGWMLA